MFLMRQGRVSDIKELQERFSVDVVNKEPMSSDSQLLKAPNIRITPHMAWASVEARERLIETVAENVRAYLNGEKKNVLV